MYMILAQNITLKLNMACFLLSPWFFCRHSLFLYERLDWSSHREPSSVQLFSNCDNLWSNSLLVVGKIGLNIPHSKIHMPNLSVGTAELFYSTKMWLHFQMY